MKNMLMVIAGLLIIAAIGVSIFDQIHYAQRKGYTVNCTHQASSSAGADSLVCVADNHQEYDAGKPYPRPWNGFFAWPEGITALLLAFTLAGISWQAWETSESASAALKSVKVQEASMRQWATVGEWKNLTSVLESDGSTLRLGYEIKNPTNYPFTLKHVKTSFGNHPQGVSLDRLIAPGASYPATYAFAVTAAQMDIYRLNQFVIRLVIEVTMKDVLERDCPPQHFTPSIAFGPDVCSAGPTPHFQMRGKKE